MIGYFTDRRHSRSRSLSAWASPSSGLLLLSIAHPLRRYPDRGVAGGTWIGGVHPESARIARLASGGALRLCAIGVPTRRLLRHLEGPVLAGAIVVPVRPALDRLVLHHRLRRDRHPDPVRHLVNRPQVAGKKAAKVEPASRSSGPPPRQRSRSRVLVALLFSKQLYVSSLSSYYIFYLIDSSAYRRKARSSISSSSWPPMPSAPISAAARRPLWPQIHHLDLDPWRAAFTLALPYAGLAASAVLTVFIGLISPRRHRRSSCSLRN